jgi:predicted phosphodiesterase
MRLVMISDTHGRHADLTIPDGDVLVHAGDFTRHRRDQYQDTTDFSDWLGSLPHAHKIVIAGNHDVGFERQPEILPGLLKHCLYLQDKAALVMGFKFYGSPWQPRFFDWAFNLERGEPLRRVWARIPTDTDVLITHTPPMGILDRNEYDERFGCADLLARVRGLAPQVHVFGHAHGGYGIEIQNGTAFVNAASVDEAYKPVHAPLVLDLPFVRSL